MLRRTGRLAQTSRLSSSSRGLGSRRSLHSIGRLRPSSSGLSKTVPEPDNEGLRFEQEVADLYNSCVGANEARRQRGSGAQWFRPGDVLTPEFLIECKKWSRPIVKKEWLEKVEDDALAYGRIPVLVIWHDGSMLAILRNQYLPEMTPYNTFAIVGGRKQIQIPSGPLDRLLIRFKDDHVWYSALPAKVLFSMVDQFVR